MTGKSFLESGTFWAGLMLFFGSVTIFINKIEYSLTSVGTEYCKDASGEGETLSCSFNKPYWLVVQMKVGMTCSLLVDWVLRRRALTSGSKDPQYAKATTTKTLLLIILPAMLDLLQSMLCFVGFLFVASSIYQMTRGSVILFSAILSKVLLKKRVQPTHYVSIAIVVCAITLVGVAAVKMDTSQKDNSHLLIGILLTVLAQLVTALQIVVEEEFLTKRNVRPCLLIGMEGFWGVLFFVVLIPILQYTPKPQVSTFNTSVSCV
jgi:drug/metabolite transporter (DMT)-like permease